jgi:hypothetical protein
MAPVAARFLSALLFASLASVSARADISIYTDGLEHGWQDPTGGIFYNFSNPMPVYSGDYSISVRIQPNGQYAVLTLEHGTTLFDATPYRYVRLALNGGAYGVPLATVWLIYQDPTTSDWQSYYTDVGALAPDTWREVSVALPASEVQDPRNLFGFRVLVQTWDPLPVASTFYVDDIRLSEVPEPSAATLIGLGLLGTCAFRWRRRSRVQVQEATQPRT